MKEQLEQEREDLEQKIAALEAKITESQSEIYWYKKRLSINKRQSETLTAEEKPAT
jgi:septal ring factor EnvC (AmiA/AmiB activator)